MGKLTKSTPSQVIYRNIVVVVVVAADDDDMKEMTMATRMTIVLVKYLLEFV